MGEREDGFLLRMRPEREGAGVRGRKEGIVVKSYDMIERAGRGWRWKFMYIRGGDGFGVVTTPTTTTKYELCFFDYFP